MIVMQFLLYFCQILYLQRKIQSLINSQFKGYRLCIIRINPPFTKKTLQIILHWLVTELVQKPIFHPEQ
jgi:hypothetical protein